MNKLFVCLLLIGLAGTASAQAFKAKQIKASALPSAIKIAGKFKEGWEWKDSLGLNYLVLAEAEPKFIAGSDEDARNAYLYAWHYVKKDSGLQRLWAVSDNVTECPLDIACEFIKGAVSITDLDKDGTAETTIQYVISCRGDVSPSSMKLIMHEGAAKYALRGNTWVAYGESSKMDLTVNNLDLSKVKEYKNPDEDYLLSFGRYANEHEFAKAPPSFIVHARQRWLKFAREKFD